MTVKSMKGMNSTGRGPSRGRKVDNRNMESLEGQAERTLGQMRCGGLSSGGQESFMWTPPPSLETGRGGKVWDWRERAGTETGLGTLSLMGWEEQALSGCRAACLHFPEARHEGARKVGEDRGLEIDSGDDCPTL